MPVFTNIASMEEAGEHISDSFIIPGYKDINAVVQVGNTIYGGTG